MHSERRVLLLYPLVGVMVFVLLSFAHDSFRLDRGIETFYLPITVGFSTGSIIAYLLNKMEIKTRRYERQLSQEREDALLGRAAAAIAHEVRNPLNAIAIGLQRLQIEAGELGSEHQRLLKLMLDSVHRANGIIGDLLRYSRPQRPKMEPLSLGQLIDDLLALYKSQCENFGIEVRISGLVADPILGDAGLLRQVAENLIRNAIEAQPDGGFLEIELKAEEDEIVLAVRNPGFSIPSGEVDRIFEPYFTTKAQGTGLGLSIAKAIIKAHGAGIEANVTRPGIIELALHFPLHQVRKDVEAQKEVSAVS